MTGTIESPAPPKKARHAAHAMSQKNMANEPEIHDTGKKQEIVVHRATQKIAPET